MIVNRERMLILHGVDPDEWARRWDIEPFSTRCHWCGIEQTTTIPFACGSLRGLVAPRCECADTDIQPPYCAVRDPRFGDLLTGRG